MPFVYKGNSEFILWRFVDVLVHFSSELICKQLQFYPLNTFPLLFQFKQKLPIITNTLVLTLLNAFDITLRIDILDIKI